MNIDLCKILEVVQTSDEELALNFREMLCWGKIVEDVARGTASGGDVKDCNGNSTGENCGRDCRGQWQRAKLLEILRGTMAWGKIEGDITKLQNGGRSHGGQCTGQTNGRCCGGMVT